MRAERLLQILMTLQAHGRQTAEALAERLEVSVRTIHRDMEALAMAGVPVYATRGAGGGWALVDDWKTDLTALARSELLALLMPAGGALLDDLGLGGAREAALAKLLASLPEGRRGQAAAWRRVHVDPTTWRGAGPQAGATFRTLQEAVFLGRQLAMTYQKADGTVSDRVVSPLGLVAKGAAWYMVALSKGEPRSFKTTRVQAATLLPEPVTAPADFDLGRFWTASAGGFEAALPRFSLTARLEAGLLPRLAFGGRFVRLEAAGPTGADGWCVAHFRCDSEEEAIAFALGLGPRLEVLEPAALRAVIARRAGQTAARYLRTPPG